VTGAGGLMAWLSPKNQLVTKFITANKHNRQYLARKIAGFNPKINNLEPRL
jgi:hypothetical protein